jgi:hypothetical protein
MLPGTPALDNPAPVTADLARSAGAPPAAM